VFVLLYLTGEDKIVFIVPSALKDVPADVDGLVAEVAQNA